MTPAAPTVRVRPDQVHDVLSRHVLTDGMKLVLDLRRSSGCRLVDARDGRRYLDMYSFFASSPLGLNPPALVDDPEFLAEIADIAVNKPANPDVYSTAYAEFVATFARVLGDPALPHLFFVEGGALAVENALKVAFDWKSQLNERAGRSPELGGKILHLTRAFHGRSGYTLSLTNTEPNKTARFPKFDWPRIDVPAITFPLADHLDDVVAAEERALDQARQAFAAASARHRRLLRRADPGRRWRQPHPAGVLRPDAAAGARQRRAVHLRRGADRRRYHRHRVGVPAAGCHPRRGGLRQEGPGRRGDGRRAGRRGARQRVRPCPAGSTPPGAAA